MNQKKFYLILLAGVFVMACFLISCEKTTNTTKPEAGPPYNPNIPVKVTSFFPDSGRYRHKVILEGENFGSDPSKIRVYFNKKRAAVVGSSGNFMYVIVPRVAQNIDCEVAVAIGNDSVVHEHKFRYSMVVMVSTLVGNGTATNTPGPLAQATITPTSIDADNNGNVFASVQNGFPGSNSADVGLVRINEDENILDIIINLGNVGALDVYSNRYQGMNFDKNTNIGYTMHRRNVNQYVILDPAENWLPRVRLINWTNPVSERPTSLNMYAGYNQHDGCIYVRYIQGQIVKIDPRTSEGTIIFKTPQQGTTTLGYGFDPKNPEWMYLTGSDGDMGHGIWRLNINSPAGTWERLNTPTTAGHRDGPIGQAMFNTPYGARFDADGIMYICDYRNHCIRTFNPETGLVGTLTGVPGKSGFKDGGPDEALLTNPQFIGIDGSGNLYISDLNNNRVRKIAIE